MFIVSSVEVRFFLFDFCLFVCLFVVVVVVVVWGGEGGGGGGGGGGEGKQTRLHRVFKPIYVCKLYAIIVPLGAFSRGKFGLATEPN